MSEVLVIRAKPRKAAKLSTACLMAARPFDRRHFAASAVGVEIGTNPQSSFQDSVEGAYVMTASSYLDTGIADRCYLWARAGHDCAHSNDHQITHSPSPTSANDTALAASHSDPGEAGHHGGKIIAAVGPVFELSEGVLLAPGSKRGSDGALDVAEHVSMALDAG